MGGFSIYFVPFNKPISVSQSSGSNARVRTRNVATTMPECYIFEASGNALFWPFLFTQWKILLLSDFVCYTWRATVPRWHHVMWSQAGESACYLIWLVCLFVFNGVCLFVCLYCSCWIWKFGGSEVWTHIEFGRGGRTTCPSIYSPSSLQSLLPISISTCLSAYTYSRFLCRHVG